MAKTKLTVRVPRDLMDNAKHLIFCPIDYPVDVGIGLHLSAVKVQLLTPHQSSFDAQLDHMLKELLKDFQSKALLDLTQAAVISLSTADLFRIQAKLYCRISLYSFHLPSDHSRMLLIVR